VSVGKGCGKARGAQCARVLTHLLVLPAIMVIVLSVPVRLLAALVTNVGLRKETERSGEKGTGGAE
jgi:hypothetical protein